MTDSYLTPEQISKVRELWIQLESEIMIHNFNNHLPVQSVAIHCGSLQRLQLYNGPLKLNYME